MSRRVIGCVAAGLLAVAGLVGCTSGGGGSSGSTSGSAGGDTEESKVRAQFDKLTKALDEHNADKIWELLDAKAQENAELKAKEIREEYAKVKDDAEKKADVEKKYLEITDQGKSHKVDVDLAKITAKNVLRTRPFHDRYDPMEKGKVEKVEFLKDGNA